MRSGAGLDLGGSKQCVAVSATSICPARAPGCMLRDVERMFVAGGRASKGHMRGQRGCRGPASRSVFNANFEK